MSYHCKNCGSVDRINHKDKCVDCGVKYEENPSKINGVKVDSIEFDEHSVTTPKGKITQEVFISMDNDDFIDSYNLIYITKDEQGNIFKHHGEDLTKEECEIIYGNISDIIVVWNMILQEKENEQ